MKKKNVFWTTVGILLLFFTLFISNSAQAATTTPTPPDKATVYQSAPSGIKLKDYVIIPSTYTSNSGTVNSSGQLITSYDTNIIELLNKNSKSPKVGSVFSNIKTDSSGNKTYNYFDLKKNQELSAWIYNGDSNAAKTATDGFAFVLQNDSKGTDAISRVNGVPTGGQTLGVWGNASGGGIANSLALEFDRYANNSSTEKYDSTSYSMPIGGTSLYSQNIKDSHISWNYPGDSGSYINSNILLHRKTPSQVTNDVPLAGYEGALLTDNKYSAKDAWRHLLISYTAPTDSGTVGTIKYTFNDKYPDGTNKMSSLVNSGTLSVDLSKFNSTDGKVYWGFTAATGSTLSGSNDVAVVIDKMPAIADVKTSVNAHDLTTNRSSSEMGTTTNNQGLTVYKPLDTFDGDQIQFEYLLQYDGGLSGTGVIKTAIALPEHIDYSGDSSGSIGSIVYLDANNVETKRVNLTKSQIEKITVTVPSNDPNTPPTSKQIDGINLNLDNMETPKEKVKILINGTAQAPVSTVASITNVNAEHTAYRGENYSGDVISPQLTINNDKLVIQNTNDLNQTINQGQTAHFKGNITHALKTAFDGNDLTSIVQIFDQDNKLVTMDQNEHIPVLLGSTQGTFDLSHDFTGLSAQTYTVKVTLSDTNHRVSNTLVYKITISTRTIKLDLYSNNNSNRDYYEKAQDITLRFSANYKPVNEFVDPKAATIFTQIDDGPWQEFKLTDDQIDSQNKYYFYLTIPKNTLELGPHSYKVYISDGSIDSNIIEHDFTTIDYGISLTPPPETTVNDNDSVNLQWQSEYTSTSISKDPLTSIASYKLQIRNLDQPDMQEFQDIQIYPNNSTSSSIPITELNSNNFNFDLNPINLRGKNMLLDHLMEGRNEIRMSVSDGFYHSNEETTYINVPKLTLQVTPEFTDYYSNNKGLPFRMTLTYNYLEDPDYTTNLTKAPVSLQTFLKYEDHQVSFSSPTPSLNDPETKTYIINNVMSYFPFVKGNTYQLTLFVNDPYNRKSADQPFNFHFVEKYSELSLNIDNYEFEDIKYDDPVNGYIHRHGKWKVSVDSTGSRWNLYAHSDGLSREDTFKKDLVFIDTNGNIEDLNTQRLIASRTTKISGQSQTDDLAGKWQDDQGILLRNNKPDLAGEYHGQIDWVLEDVPD